MKIYLLLIFISIMVSSQYVFSQNDYSVNLGKEGLQFVKINSKSRLILMNRNKVVVPSNITKINNFKEHVFGERSGDEDNFFLLNVNDLSVLYFSKKEDLIIELKKHHVIDIVFLEPGIFAKR